MIEINFTFGLAIYGMIWFLSLFIILPFGVVTQEEKGDIEPGSPKSAPHQPNIFKKMCLTTLLATVLYGFVFWVLTSGVLSANA